MEYEEIEYELSNGEIVMLSFEADFTATDEGIGSYEYWGAKCRDVYWVNVCEDINGVSAINEEGEDIFDSLPEAEKKSIYSFCEEYANEHAPEVE